jgi:YVTN family beta-propeller protein
VTTEHIIDKKYLLLLILGILLIAIIILPYLLRKQDYKIVESSPSLIGKTYSESSLENNPKANNLEELSNDDQDSKAVPASFSNTTKSNRFSIMFDSHPKDIAVNPETNKIYVASYESNTTYVIDGNTNKLINQIPVGGHPLDIAIAPDPYTGREKLYVVLEVFRDTKSPVSNTASVIDVETSKVLHNFSLQSELTDHQDSIAYDKNLNMIYLGSLSSFDKVVYEIDAETDKVIGNITTIQDSDVPSSIPYYPLNFASLGMAVDSKTNIIYAVDSDYDVVDVMDPYIDKHLDRIQVEKNPVAVDINEVTNKIYVANYGTDTISVIDLRTHKIIDNITVGQQPNAIAVNQDTNKIYVATDSYDTIYTIDGDTDKISAGVLFNINPPDSGHIKCGSTQPTTTNKYQRIGYGIACRAESNNGFQFSSWSQNLGDNSSKIISSSTISDSPFNSLLTTLGFKQQDNSAIFNVTKYGNYTANFRALPPPIPAEYWIPLYGIIVSSIVGWSIPSIIGWAKSKSQGRRLHYYYKRIESLYDDGKLDYNDIGHLDKLRSDITDAYTRGKMSELQYGMLKEEISTRYQELYNKRLDSLNSKLNENNNNGHFAKIRYDIEDAYARRKISELQYNLLNKRIADYENKLIQQ